VVNFFGGALALPGKGFNDSWEAPPPTTPPTGTSANLHKKYK